MENYRLSSAMSINGSIRLAGTIVSMNECTGFSAEVLEELLADSHLVPTNAPVTTDVSKRPGINRLLPRSKRPANQLENPPSE